MAIVANPMDFFRGDAAVRSWLYSSTIDFDVDLGQAMTIPNPWGRKEVNIKKTRCGQLTGNISAKTWSFFIVIELVPFSDIWLSIMKEMRAIGTIPMERGHGMWSCHRATKSQLFYKKCAIFGFSSQPFHFMTHKLVHNDRIGHFA